MNSLSATVHLEYEVSNRVTLSTQKARLDVVVYHYCSDKVVTAPVTNLA